MIVQYLSNLMVKDIPGASEQFYRTILQEL